ncbi:unnamed protein product [Penicillium salamii]|uniref:C2 domain-containing protein n=1 Tax=Penicillium salamii TaxID=1612424 RepID=A0A9W4J3Z8_9EURO|nr:unnamed protein product [Penicillium salamii]CAG8069979.1 unnamed protein product [Penicillium salamii]CAG8169560.1 unnamed protein product [Penicillium salamii]CAG8231459.1 unnamed protein product [Penicillium salamii]CAG8246747.1 unnamed protein product [Penicillium salamii]
MSKLTKVNHAAGIFADISVDGPIIGTLVAIIDRAKNLPNRKTMGKQNPYAAARLGKEAKKTQTDLRGGQTPRWDSELRFTVHESPDYYKLKVSVFNDDKKTDMIGETWVDLQNLIIAGGSQNDHWHPLQCRGKYAGEIRIEMTYYDTRQQDEAIIERRQEAADRVQGKIPSTPSATGLSGPRQLKDVKRRPLPSGPAGAPPPPRPAVLEQTHSAPPLHHPAPSRPAIPEHLNSVSSAPEPIVHPMRQSEPVYDASTYRAPSPAPPPSRGGYDGAEAYAPEWENPAVAPLRRPNTHEVPYAPQEVVQATYDTRPLQPRSQSDYDQPPSRDYRMAREQTYEPDPREVMYHSGHQDPYIQPEQPRYSADHMSYGAPPTRELPPSEYMVDPAHDTIDDMRYRQRGARPLQLTARPHDWHPEYAGMQPRVEDEDDDLAPPPPPAHRSRRANSQLPTPNTSPSPYASYTPRSAPRSPAAHIPSSMSTPSRSRYQEPASTRGSPAVPASLVAGYETEDSSERAAFERSARRPSNPWDDEMMFTDAPAPVPVAAPAHYDAPVYPLRTSPRPAIDQRPVSSRGVSPDTRAVTRKSVSVSPRPSSSDGRGGSSVPFSPDSYASLNPHTSRPSSRDPSPMYDTPSQARDAVVRGKTEPRRDADQPIIGDDGREIDPSDHLPTDTWAPEPERKNRKPEVIIRFKHSPRPTSRGNDAPAPAPRSSGPPRVGFSPHTTTYPADRQIKYTPTHHVNPGAVVRTPPRADYSRGRSDSYQSRGYSTPTSTDRPRSSRGSVSPTPSARSPLYDYNTGPPIPSKVPISGGSPSYPVMSGNPNMGRMDALSRELSTIDIGSAGCSPGRGAMRKYIPRAPASMGYAS